MMPVQLYEELDQARRLLVVVWLVVVVVVGVGEAVTGGVLETAW